MCNTNLQIYFQWSVTFPFCIVFHKLHPNIKESQDVYCTVNIWLIDWFELLDPNHILQISSQREYIICSESFFDQSLLQSPKVSSELFNLSRRRVKTHLHAVTLSDYIRQGVIPSKVLDGGTNPCWVKKNWRVLWMLVCHLNKCAFDLMIQCCWPWKTWMNWTDQYKQKNCLHPSNQNRRKIS